LIAAPVDMAADEQAKRNDQLARLAKANAALFR
jgi:hypothetical protein